MLASRLTFGLIVLAMIYTVGDISGAHLNPAVSLGFFAARRFPLPKLILYVFSQCAGALTASGILCLLFPQNALLGATLPAVVSSAVICARSYFNCDLNVCNFGRVDRCGRKRHHRGNRCRRSHWSRSNVRGADLWSVNEPGTVVGAGVDLRLCNTSGYISSLRQSVFALGC